MLTVKLPADVEQRLAHRAAAAGEAVEALASRILAEAVNSPTIEEILAPVRQRFAASGLSEDESADLLEAEKHDMREVRHGRRSS